MGSHSDNGGWPNDDRSPDELPELPDEWGVIVIPDDLSELADEVRAVRAELALTEPRTRWQRFAARPAVRRIRRMARAGVRAPVLIIAMAVLVTVASLFAATWPNPARSPVTQRTANNADEPASTTGEPAELPALEMIGPDGRTVALLRQLPAVVLLTDGCDCARLIADTTTAVRPEIAVVTVTSAVPSGRAETPPTGATPHAQGKIVRNLNDPTGTLRNHLKLGTPDGTAAALLVNQGGEIVGTHLRVSSVAAFQADLARL
jgi:hypothetical protein